MSFADSIKAFQEKALRNANTQVTKATFVHLGGDLVKYTLPSFMDQGKFSNGDIANNWHVQLGQPSELIPNGPDRSGTASLVRFQAELSSNLFYRKDNTVFITNAMNYSYRANYIGWPAGQGTNGWTWTNNIKGYGFLGIAVNNLKGKLM